MKFWLLFIAFSAAFAVATSSASISPASCGYNARVKLISDFNVLGLFSTTGWWNSANVFTAIVNDAILASDPTLDDQVLTMLEQTFTLYGYVTRFTDDYNDDEGWWALMFVRAHELALRRNRQKLAGDFFGTSVFLWHDMAKSWNDTAAACGGGIWWSKTTKYKNAIANELFFALAAEIALRTKSADEKTYFTGWAQKELDWFVKSGMINSAGTINDGLTSDCKNNGDTTWTYNQGVILGGLAALYQVDNNTAHLNLAVSIYSAAVAALTNDGVLHEPCEPNCGSSGCQFKGIFARNVMYLENVLSKIPAFSNATSAMRSFIATNAASICSHDAGSGGLLGIVWSGPFDNSTASACTTGSAYDCLVANR